MSIYDTGFISSNLGRCGDIDELKEELLPLLQSQRASWAEKIEQILSEKNFTCRQFAELCRVSEPAVRKWRKGSLPQSRDMYIRIGFAAGYDLDGMNAFLKRYGKCPQLYVKSLEDSVCMFVLQSESLTHTYEAYLNLLDLVRREIQGTAVEERPAFTTAHLSEFFSSVKTTEEMIEFAKANAPSYKQSYFHLYGYIIAFIQINIQKETEDVKDNRKGSFHAMAEESEWSSSLRHCVSEIRGKKWFPLRHKVISLGLHLNMDTEEINTMLEYAQMEPLYAKNPIEAAIIWAVEEAKLLTPEDEIIPDGSSDLCGFVKDVLVQLGLGDENVLKQFSLEGDYSYMTDDL